MLNPEKFWSIYADYLESGLTVRAYCANHRMNEAKFYYWRPCNLPHETGIGHIFAER
jgi:hypothetical protein